MTTPLSRRIATLVVIAGFAFLNLAPAVGAANDPPEEAAALLSIGDGGPKAIDLKIRTDKPEGYTFQKGDSLVLHLKAAQEAYLTAIYVSSRGDAVVLFPNNEAPNGLIARDQEITLFGEDSGIKVKIVDEMEEGQIVFYVASTPLRLEPLKAAEGQPCLRISHSDKRDLKLLRAKLEGLAKDEVFNRLVMQLRATGKDGFSLTQKGLPTGVKSERPETITGVQGQRPEREKPE